MLRTAIKVRRTVMVVAVVATASACGSQTTVRTITTAAAHQAQVGDTLALAGNRGESMTVTVNRVIDPLSVGPYDPRLKARKRYVGVQITLTNVGRVAYSDAPSNDATLFSDTHGQAVARTVSGGPCGNGLDSGAHVAPGESQGRCVVFEMPPPQTPEEFQFTLDSGFANQTGEWKLVPGSAVSAP